MSLFCSQVIHGSLLPPKSSTVFSLCCSVSFTVRHSTPTASSPTLHSPLVLTHHFSYLSFPRSWSLLPLHFLTMPWLPHLPRKILSTFWSLHQILLLALPHYSCINLHLQFLMQVALCTMSRTHIAFSHDYLYLHLILHSWLWTFELLPP